MPKKPQPLKSTNVVFDAANKRLVDVVKACAELIIQRTERNYIITIDDKSYDSKLLIIENIESSRHPEVDRVLKEDFAFQDIKSYGLSFITQKALFAALPAKYFPSALNDVLYFSGQPKTYDLELHGISDTILVDDNNFIELTEKYEEEVIEEKDFMDGIEERLKPLFAAIPGKLSGDIVRSQMVVSEKINNSRDDVMKKLSSIEESLAKLNSNGPN